MARSRRPSHGGANERPQNRRTPKPVPKVSLRERFSSGFGWLGARWDRIKQGLWLLVRLALASALAAGLVSGSRLVEHYLHASPKFAIEQIEVQGNQRLTRDVIIEAAGLKVGQNVFDVSPDEVKRRLLELPWLESAEVHRRLPDKYQLQVRERRAAALLATPELQLVSEDGVVFKPLAAGDPYDLPVITGISAVQLNADKRAAAGALVSAVALLHDYQDAGLWRREIIAEVHVDSDGSLSLYIGKDPTQVRLGKPPFRQKLERLREVITMLSSQQTRASYVLLDNQRRLDRVTVRLR